MFVLWCVILWAAAWVFKLVFVVSNAYRVYLHSCVFVLVWVQVCVNVCKDVIVQYAYLGSCASACVCVLVEEEMAEEGKISRARLRWHTSPVKRALHLTVQLLHRLRWVALVHASKGGWDTNKYSHDSELIDQCLNLQITLQWLFVQRNLKTWLNTSPHRGHPSPSGFLHISWVTDISR